MFLVHRNVNIASTNATKPNESKYKERGPISKDGATKIFNSLYGTKENKALRTI